MAVRSANPGIGAVCRTPRGRSKRQAPSRTNRVWTGRPGSARGRSVQRLVTDQRKAADRTPPVVLVVDEVVVSVLEVLGSVVVVSVVVSSDVCTVTVAPSNPLTVRRSSWVHS